MLAGRGAVAAHGWATIMSRSLHVTERDRKREHSFNRDDSGLVQPGPSKLDELALKKTAAKETERWKRDARKTGGLRHVEFVLTNGGWRKRNQKRRGIVSDVPGEVLPPKEKVPDQTLTRAIDVSPGA